MSSPLVCTPMRVERAALRGVVSAPVVRTGMGPTRRIDFTGPVLVAGVAGALTDDLCPGDLVVASELRTADMSVECHAAPLVFDAAHRLGLRVHLAPLLHPGIVRRGIIGLRALRATAPAIDQWAAAVGDREIVCGAMPDDAG